MEHRPSSKFLVDLECWDKITRKVIWENGLDMKNALEKTREVNKRAPEFYKIAWIEEEELEDDYDAEIKKQQVDVVEECGENRFQVEPHKADPAGTNGRKKWKIQHFSEFKNDKVKREQVRKFIKSKDLMIPAEKLVMKPLVARKKRLVE